VEIAGVEISAAEVAMDGEEEAEMYGVESGCHGRSCDGWGDDELPIVKPLTIILFNYKIRLC
jgi:hypothetical protein